MIAFRDSIVVSISACHADDPGSIPGRGVLGCAFLKLFYFRIALCHAVGDLAQMVERSLSMREALGSMPRFSIFPVKKRIEIFVAQR